ncbi:MAG: fibronectin type III domain-containing protein, partial [Dehalococcoidales bacterium]|nr:fibronectin type III domain-containing protein [Dehalococcoidales bacterium]
DLGPDADIVSLDIAEDGNGIELVAGGEGGVWYSPDAGESWQPSLKAPTGGGVVYVAAAADFSHSGVAYAVTSGTESAFSISRDHCLTWNQTSLIDTEISDIIDLAPSPRYSQDSTLFMLTHQDGGEHSLWRSRDGAWERVFCSGLPDVDKLEGLELSPRYGGDNNVVLVAGVSNGSPSIWKSNDDGQSFSRRSTPLPVDAWAVVDDSRWFIGGHDGSHGLVYHTANSGLSYSEGAVAGDQSLNSIALSPDYSEDETLLVGNNDGWVYWSEDNGKSFQPLPPDAVSAPLSGELAVAFDPEYGSNGTVYATSNSAGEGIYRFVVGGSSWKNIDSPVGGMTGQMVLSAEGALYSANFDADGGMERCLNPTFPLGPSFESVTRGLDDGAKLVGLWLHGQQLWSIDSQNNKVMTYIDSLTAPVSLTSPLDGAPGVGTLIEDTAMNISLDWETLPGATDYQWQLNYETDFSSLPDGFEGTTQSSSVHLADLEPATTYYWRVKAIEPTLSPWSEKWSFTTSLGRTVTAPNLHSPEAGASGVSVSPIFQWSAIAGADSYELMVSTSATFDNPTILKTDGYALPSTAWQCNISLNYDTTYYWKVRAVSADSCSAWSAVSAFTTEAAPSPMGTVAEVPQPNSPQESAWPEWLLPVGGVIMLVFLLTMIAMLITMIVLVIKVSKL